MPVAVVVAVPEGELQRSQLGTPREAADQHNRERRDAGVLRDNGGGDVRTRDLGQIEQVVHGPALVSVGAPFTVVSMDPPWVRLTLDVENFDAGAFVDVVAGCVRSGIVFWTIAELGDREPNHRRLYELNRTCSADIPERGEFYTYTEYRAERIKVPTFDPSTVVIALDGDEWVGMSAASDHRDAGYFFNEMTGVLRSHRGRGIALAVKVIVIERVRELGVPTIRTFHHPDNPAPIALNRRLGYVDAEALPPTTRRDR